MFYLTYIQPTNEDVSIEECNWDKYSKIGKNSKEILGPIWDVWRDLWVNGGGGILFGGEMCQQMSNDITWCVDVGIPRVVWFWLYIQSSGGDYECVPVYNLWFLSKEILLVGTGGIGGTDMIAGGGQVDEACGWAVQGGWITWLRPIGWLCSSSVGQMSCWFFVLLVVRTPQIFQESKNY